MDFLRSIAKHPDQVPRTIILSGAYGTGKTTLARIFARLLNCQHPISGDLCGKCPACLMDLESDPMYKELDSTQVGNVEYLREFKSFVQFSTVPDGQWRVIVLDEFHATSKAGQGALLKIMEEVPQQTFWVICTTDPGSIIDTILSRSIELPMELLPAALIAERLKVIAAAEQLEIPDNVLQRIASYSGGHVRNAVMRLDMFVWTTDKEVFVKRLARAEDLILAFLAAVAQKDLEKVRVVVGQMVQHPLAQMFLDWESVVLGLTRQYVGIESKDSRYAALCQVYGSQVFKLIKVLAAEWVERCFKDDLLFQGWLWYLYYELKQEQSASADAKSSGADRFRK